MTDLKDQVVTQISLGKAHAVALTKEGHIFTFGINNKGQCGRDFTPGATKDGECSESTPGTTVNEPRREKTGLLGFRPGPAQTGLYSHRRWLEA